MLIVSWLVATALAGAPSGGLSGVWIKRGDHGKQCAPDTAESLESGARELQGARIQILESKKAHDGKMHIQVCGADSGSENSYRVREQDLPKASALGFEPVNPPDLQAGIKKSKVKRRKN